MIKVAKAREKFHVFRGFSTKCNSFPNESYEQWLSAALSIQMKQDPQKFPYALIKSSEPQNFSLA